MNTIQKSIKYISYLAVTAVVLAFGFLSSSKDTLLNTVEASHPAAPAPAPSPAVVVAPSGDDGGVSTPAVVVAPSGDDGGVSTPAPVVLPTPAPCYIYCGYDPNADSEREGDGGDGGGTEDFYKEIK